MSGSGGGGGYEYQAQATAYIASHILAQQPLHWIEHSTSDIPVAVAEETDGPGDDINITLQDGISVELQAKHGLRKNEDFWEAVIKLIRGLVENPSLYGVLLTDSTASSTIRDNLRQDLEKLGQGRTDSLKAITREVIEKLEQEGIAHSSDIFRRLRIVVADLDSSQRDAKTALVLLGQVLSDRSQIGQVWKILGSEGLNLITKRGRRDGASLLRLLSSENIQVSSAKANSALIERYLWLDSAMRVSKARCLERWTGLGVSESDAAVFAADSSIGLPPSNLLLSPGKLVVLVGEMGSGKSLIGERILQAAIETAQKSSTSQIPIFIEARDIQGKSLERSIQENIPTFCNFANEDILIIIDEIDEIGVSNAIRLLKEARVLAQTQQHIALFLIGRPVLEFINAKESVRMHLLEREASELLVRQLSRQTNFSSNSLPQSLQKAILCPLFAVLLGSYLQERGAWTLQTKEQLLSDLVERSLCPLQENVAKARQLLGQLAAACIDKAGKAVSSTEFASWVEGQQLLDSRLVVVVEDTNGLRFAMPILAQWFAAQHLLTNSSLVITFAKDKQRLELWQYPLVIAVATFPPNRVSELLSPIAESQPALAASIVSEALAFQGRSMDTPSVSALEVGKQVRDAMQSWLSGFKEFATLLPFTLKDGTLPTLGIRLGQRILGEISTSKAPLKTSWVEIAWHSSEENVANKPVVSLPTSKSGSDSDDLWSLGWKSVHGFLPYSQVSWAWKWTLEQIMSLLLEQRAIPVGTGYLSLEAAWFAALYITQRRPNYIHPIPLNEIENILFRIEDLRFPPIIQHCLRQLRIEVEAAHTRSKTHLSLPSSYLVFHSTQLSNETVKDCAEDIYREAFEGYQQLVSTLYPHFLPTLPLASILPIRLTIILVPPNSSSGDITWSWYWEPLPEGSKNEVRSKLGNHSLLVNNPDIHAAHEKMRLMRPRWSKHFSYLKTQTASRFWLGNNPVTELAYQWLWEDLKLMSWVSGELRQEYFSGWYPISRSYSSGLS